MSQMSLDFAGLPLNWIRAAITGQNILVCGTVCVGSVFKCVGSYRARVGYVEESWLLGEYADEPTAMAALEAAVRGEMAGRSLEWDDVSCPGVPSQHLYIGELMIGRLYPWHAVLACWPEEFTCRPIDMAKGRRTIEAEARQRMAS